MSGEIHSARRKKKKGTLSWRANVNEESVAGCGKCSVRKYSWPYGNSLKAIKDLQNSRSWRPATWQSHIGRVNPDPTWRTEVITSTYKRTRKHIPVSNLSSDFQLCSQGLLCVQNFFGSSSRFKHFWHFNVMITEVRFIAIRIEAPLSLSLSPSWGWWVLFLSPRIRETQKNGALVSERDWRDYRRSSLLRHVSCTGSCRHGRDHGHGHTHAHAFSRAKPSPAQVDQAMVRNLLFFLFLFFFNALSWTKFHKPLGYLFFQIHLLFEVCWVFKLSTLLGNFAFFFRVTANGRDGLLGNWVFPLFHNRYLQCTDAEFLRICAMYTYPQNIFFNCEKDHHSKFCDVQLGNFPSSSYL